MSRPLYSAIAAASLVALLAGFAPLHALAQTTRSASTSVRIQVMVQPYIHIQRNEHPSVLNLAGDPTTAEHQLQIQTNQPHGFCLDLIPSPAAPALAWELQAVHGEDLVFHPTAQGYRLCGARPGAYRFTLTHHFQAPAATPWPLVASLSQF